MYKHIEKYAINKVPFVRAAIRLEARTHTSLASLMRKITFVLN